MAPTGQHTRLHQRDCARKNQPVPARAPRSPGQTKVSLPATSRLRVTAIAVGAIVFVSIVYIAALPPILDAAGGLQPPAKLLLTLILASPLAFAMGIPFPIALQHVSDTRPTLLAWAWGINGCTSVAGASCATLIAVHWGFATVITVTSGAYLLALAGLARLMRSTDG